MRGEDMSPALAGLLLALERLLYHSINQMHDARLDFDKAQKANQ
jgi:hypothetical protein